LKLSDARIILATNHNLEHLLEMKKFRKDLYYRLCTYQINIPPMRERMEDLPLLLDHFVSEAALALGKAKPVISADVPVFLAQYNFPGNIREFKALVADAVARHKTGLLSLQYFSGITSRARFEPDANGGGAQYDDPLCAIFGKFPTLLEVEEYTISNALRVAGGKQSVAATLLGITRQGLYKRMKTK
jgi:DNA-binding NtrC family response regulator